MKIVAIIGLVLSGITALCYALFHWISDVINQPYIYLLIGAVIALKTFYKLSITIIRYKALKNFNVHEKSNN